MAVEGEEQAWDWDMGADDSDGHGRASIERHAYSRRVVCQRATRATVKHGWAWSSHPMCSTDRVRVVGMEPLGRVVGKDLGKPRLDSLSPKQSETPFPIKPAQPPRPLFSSAAAMRRAQYKAMDMHYCKFRRLHCWLSCSRRVVFVVARSCQPSSTFTPKAPSPTRRAAGVMSTTLPTCVRLPRPVTRRIGVSSQHVNMALVTSIWVGSASGLSPRFSWQSLRITSP